MTAREVCLIIIVALIPLGCSRNEGGPRLPVLGRAYVGSKTLAIRRDIGFHTETVAEVRFGDRLDVLQRRRFNLQVRTQDNITGWIDGRSLIGAREVEALKQLAQDHRQTARMAVARASDTLRIHTTPNRESPGFEIAAENERFDVLGHRLALRAPYLPPALPEKAARKKGKKKAPDENFTLPPPPAPPKPPENWQELSGKTDEEEAAPGKKKAVRNVKNALLLKAEESSRKKGPVYDDWSLVRLQNGSVGWALTNALVMDLPDDLMNQVGRFRVTSFFPLGEVHDPEAGPKRHWFFTTISKRAQVHQFDGMGLAFFSTKSHKYVRIFQQTGVVGYFPVEVSESGGKPVVAVILENPDGSCWRRRFVLDGNRLKLLDQHDVPRPRTPQSLDDLPATSIPEPAEDEERTWWGQVMKNLFGK